jgi:hypothetical protein
MSLNPLTPVTDYQSMLNRIFWFTSAAALVAVWLLRVNVPTIDLLLKKIDFSVAFASDKILPMPAGYLLPALAVGMFTRIYRLHARISDWLGIRESFDVDVIIAEFADQLAFDLTLIPEERLTECRHGLMRRIFYPYVSGPQTPIDPQLIQQALDAWSWFWIGIEATLVFLLTGLTLVAARKYEPGFETLGTIILFAVNGLPTLRNQCRRYAIAQIRAIFADPTRAAAVRAAFADLTAGLSDLRSYSARRAA